MTQTLKNLKESKIEEILSGFKEIYKKAKSMVDAASYELILSHQIETIKSIIPDRIEAIFNFARTHLEYVKIFVSLF